ncbi:MAG TPA: hypothetical protein VGS12_01695 [Caulobacteraceae bacterium]|nr:hypothetical protein [Caulobacteraceae bacterium]
MSDTERTSPETLSGGRAEGELTTASLAQAQAPAAEARSFAGAGSAQTSDERAPLLPADEAGGLRQRWDGIQARFVDEPRTAVEEADKLVAGAMQRLAEVFASERAKLEGQWDKGGDVSTEDLRQALQRYRSFFGRLLAV